MEDGIGAGFDQLFSFARRGQIGRPRINRTGEAGGRFRLEHVDKREPVDRPATERPVLDETLRQLAANHTCGADDCDMHVFLLFVPVILPRPKKHHRPADR
ncbi:hypothetical protein D3C86_1601030 [compost metagenome]